MLAEPKGLFVQVSGYVLKLAMVAALWLMFYGNAWADIRFTMASGLIGVIGGAVQVARLR